MCFEDQNENKYPLTMDPIDVDVLVERCLKLLKSSKLSHDNDSSCNQHNQIFIGIAGTPGSGKSHIAEAVKDRIKEISPNCDAVQDEAVVIPMDGYHLTRQQLKEMAEQGKTFKSVQLGEDSKEEERRLSYNELMKRRGATFTYCPKQFIKDLKAVKENGEGSFPIYDRSKHDPVPNGVSVYQQNKIIFVEGLYLLCLDDPEWKELASLWDDKWYIDVSMEETRRRLVERHLKSWNDEKTKQFGGSDREAAGRKADGNDMLNAKCIKPPGKQNANLIIVNEEMPKGEKIEDKAPTKEHEEPLKDSSLYA